MAEGAFSRAAKVTWAIAESNRDRRKQSRAHRVDDFNPYARSSQQPTVRGIPLTKDTFKLLKMAWCPENN